MAPDRMPLSRFNGGPAPDNGRAASMEALIISSLTVALVLVIFAGIPGRE